MIAGGARARRLQLRAGLPRPKNCAGRAAGGQARGSLHHSRITRARAGGRWTRWRPAAAAPATPCAPAARAACRGPAGQAGGAQRPGSVNAPPAACGVPAQQPANPPASGTAAGRGPQALQRPTHLLLQVAQIRLVDVPRHVPPCSAQRGVHPTNSQQAGRGEARQRQPRVQETPAAAAASGPPCAAAHTQASKKPPQQGSSRRAHP